MSKLSPDMLALLVASEAHRDQRRKDSVGTPYINHPIFVGTIVSSVSNDKGIIAAAYLHDVIEDTALTEEYLRKLFSDRIVDIVLEVTDDKSLPKATRKLAQIAHAPKLSYGAANVKVADKFANIEDLIAPEATCTACRLPPTYPTWSIKDRVRYATWASAVVKAASPKAHPRLVNLFNLLYSRFVEKYSDYIEEYKYDEV